MDTAKGVDAKGVGQVNAVFVAVVDVGVTANHCTIRPPIFKNPLAVADWFAPLKALANARAEINLELSVWACACRDVATVVFASTSA